MAWSSPVTFHGGWQWLRVSAQLYNTLADYERLAAALGQLREDDDPGRGDG